MIAEKIADYIQKSPSPFHATDNMARIYKKAGFKELSEKMTWDIHPGGRYYVIRNGSAIIAFTVPEDECNNFRIVASHNDSPAFKVKENPEILRDGKYVLLNTEKYGGMIMSSWLDRPLSLAGRVIYEENTHIKSINVNLDRDALVIPNLAIHMNRDLNEGYKYNPQNDMLPLYGADGEQGKYMDEIASAAGTDADRILGCDIFVYNRQQGCIWGQNGEFISSPRLDDLMCAFISTEALASSEKTQSICMSAVFNNEETGSSGNAGADSDLLETVLRRICISLGADEEKYYRMLSDSFMISADNAHAVHPCHQDKADPTNRPYINGGIVIKSNAAQKYSTDAVTEAVFKMLCREAKAEYRTYVNRSDIPGGSTLGNISASHVSIPTVDVGIAQLAMHSAYETAGTHDMEDFYRILKIFFGYKVEFL